MRLVKAFFLASAAVAVVFLGCMPAEQPSAGVGVDVSGGAIKVGIFDGHGGAQTCVWEAYEAVRRDGDMRPYYVTSADIASGALDTLCALIIPGGGGSTQWLNLGPENHGRITDFVTQGGGIVGICAGAYMLSTTPDYACMGLSQGKAIDIEHDNRGHGVANVTLGALGRELFPELAGYDTIRIMYYEGPVYDTVQMRYAVFATMESDVHTEGGAPSDMTNGRPFLIGNDLGDGRVMACIAHPESTPGMQWMVPRMVRWSLKKEIAAYDSAVVQPLLLGEECLMSEEMLKQESDTYKTFLYGTTDEKLEALAWLRSVLSWSAKRWVQGLLYDGDARVRVAAAEYIAWMGYTRYLPDVRAAAASEEDGQAKVVLARAVANLEAQIAEANR